MKREVGKRETLEAVAGVPPRPDTRCTPRPTVTRAAPHSRSLGSSLCARFTRSWTPVRIFTVSGTSSTCGDECGQQGAEPGGGRWGHLGIPGPCHAQSAETWPSGS